MKKLLIFSCFMAFFLTLSAQTDIKKNAFYLGFGSVVSYKMESFSPAIDFYYNRTLGKGWEFNAGYKFKNYDLNPIPPEHPSSMPIYYQVYDYQAHVLFIGMAYAFRVNHFSLSPMLGTGYGFTKLIANKSSGDKNIEFPLISLGLSLAYNLNSWMFFCSYNYDFPFFSNSKLAQFFSTTDRVIFTKKTEYYFNSDIKVGIGYKF